MKDNTMGKFLAKRIIGIPIAAVGAHLFWCYFLKVLPFGLNFDPYSEELLNQVIWTIWGYGGFWISFIMLIAGSEIALRKPDEECVNKEVTEENEEEVWKDELKGHLF